MGRFAYLAVLAALLVGCVPIRQDPARTLLGVSTARESKSAVSPTDAEIAALDRKANQICVHGYTRTRLDVEPAEAGEKIVDMKLRCRPYDRLDFDYVDMSWSNLL